MNQQAQVEEFQFQAEMSQLLHLITHSLYSHREIFLRELISNASDALSKLHFASLTQSDLLKDEGDLQITITLDEEKKTLTIADNGVGMTKEELIANLGTIANSGTANFAKNLTGDKTKDIELIGRFGVGFYAVFMVAEEVSVETKSCQGGTAHRWVSKGTGKYSIEETESQQRGTSITFTLKEDAEEFAKKWKVEETIKRYSDFVSFPIELNGEKINQSSALWSKNKNEISEEQYKEFYQYISHRYDDPMHRLHLAAEAPVQFKALLYIPSEADRNLFTTELETSLRLYVKKVFIQSDCKDLLPQWLRFVNGVVDSEDLPLNISREVTQHSAMMHKIQKYLVKKLLGDFAAWAESDKEKYTAFWRAFGNFIKEGLHTDYANKDKLIELYRAASSKEPQGLVSLSEYLERMPENQKEIYFVYGKTQEAIEANPNLEYFKRNELEVLYLYDEVDHFIMPGLGPYKEKQLVAIDKAEVDLSKEEEQKKRDLSEEKKKSILEKFKKVLGERVADVIESKRLVDNPCTLVAGQGGMDAQMERMMKMMDPNFAGGKKILEINTRSPLIKSLAKIHERKPKDKTIKEVILELFEGASLLEGSLEDPSSLVTRQQRLLAQLAELYAKSLAN